MPSWKWIQFLLELKTLHFLQDTTQSTWVSDGPVIIWTLQGSSPVHACAVPRLPSLSWIWDAAGSGHWIWGSVCSKQQQKIFKQIFSENWSLNRKKSKNYNINPGKKCIYTCIPTSSVDRKFKNKVEALPCSLKRWRLSTFAVKPLFVVFNRISTDDVTNEWRLYCAMADQ